MRGSDLNIWGMTPTRNHVLRGLIAALLVGWGAGCSPGTDVPEYGAMEADFLALDERDGVYLLNGQPFQGVARMRHGDGTAKGEYPMRNGKMHGVVKEWWENGRQAVETHFEDGQRHGKNTYWDMQGRLTKLQVYERGKSVSEETFSHSD
jgi:hypothetical protein